MRCTINLATYLARQTAVNGHGWLCVLLLFLVYLFMFNYLKIHRTDLRQILTVGRTTVVDDQFEISFSLPQGTRCHGNPVLLVSSTEPVGVAGCRRLAAQPGGLTSDFARHLSSC